MIFLSSNSIKIVSNVSWITGCARSGTTMMGEIIKTLKNTLYSFEPETLLGLLILKKKNFINFEKIYENYISQDLYYNLYNQESKKVIRRKDFNKLALKKFFIKLPDNIKNICQIKKIYKKNSIYCMHRNPIAILRSTIKKKWFYRPKDRLFPLYKKNNKFYPYWLDLKKYKEWDTLNNNERSALSIIKNYNEIKINKKMLNIINYDKIVRNPELILDIIKKNNLKPTKETYKRLDNIKFKKTELNINSFNLNTKIKDQFSKILNLDL